MSTSSNFRKVTPHHAVRVSHNGLWLGGELEAWRKHEGRWFGLVKFYLPTGASVIRWFDKDDILDLLPDLSGGLTKPEDD